MESGIDGYEAQLIGVAHERIRALEAKLADICTRLRGIPGPDGSRLDGDGGLAAATMLAHDYYEAECEKKDKAIGEAVGELMSERISGLSLDVVIKCEYPMTIRQAKLFQIAAKLEAVVTSSR